MTGRRPFAAAPVAETLDQVRSQEPVPPRRLNPAIPRDLETICLKCLRKEPGQRYDSAGPAADDLRRFLDGVAISARPGLAAREDLASVPPASGRRRAGRRIGLHAVRRLPRHVPLWRHAESQRGQAEFQWTRAEEAQARAEADFQLAAELLDQLVELSAGGQSHLPRRTVPTR